MLWLELPDTGWQGSFHTVDFTPEGVTRGMFPRINAPRQQFNSMVQERKDAIAGVVREAVLMSRVDAEPLGL